jgi:hypothetical protein
LTIVFAPRWKWALEKACLMLPPDKADEHSARSHVAQGIIDAARGGSRTLVKLTAAGRKAAIDLAIRTDCADSMDRNYG